MANMSRCVLCGGENEDDTLLCRHHTVGDEEWAHVNRLFCNFLHRGIEPSYPVVAETGDEPWVVLDVEPDSEAMAVA